MKFKTFINEAKEYWLELTNVEPGYLEVAYATSKDAKAGFSKGLIRLHTVKGILKGFDYKNNPLPKDLKDKIDAELFTSAQKQINK